MKLVDRYVLKSHLGPFLFGFFVITGVLFTEVFKNFLDDFLAKGISPLTITEVLVLSLGHTLALSIPMAVLVATLMAFGQMAADNEITALRAAGINLYRVMSPVMLAAGLLCGGMVLFNNYVLPESNHRLAGLSSDITRTRPTVNIEPGLFVDALEGYELLIGGKDEHSDEVSDVQVYVLKQGRSPDILVAPRGRLHYENAGNTLYIELFDGELHSLPEDARPEEAVYRVTRFREHTVVIDDVGNQLERTDHDYRSDREMSIGMLHQSIVDKRRQIGQHLSNIDKQARTLFETKLELLDRQRRAEYFARQRPAQPGRLGRGVEERLRDTARMESGSVDAYERQIRSLQVEVHKKFAIPVACVVFVLLGAPLAIRSGRSGMTMAIGFSIACFFLYYLFITGGEKLADRQMLSPFVAMWLANLVFGALGTILTWRASTEITVINWQRLHPRRWLPIGRRRATA
jgi:lipopolysaccharide export system permease protein